MGKVEHTETQFLPIFLFINAINLITIIQKRRDRQNLANRQTLSGRYVSQSLVRLETVLNGIRFLTGTVPTISTEVQISYTIMKSKIIAGFLAFAMLFLAGYSNSVNAASLGLNFLNPKKVEADPKKEYLLTEEHGPWLIFVHSFSGEYAKENANRLVLELRSRYKMNAYVYSKRFDFNVEDGLRPTERVQLRKEKYLKTAALEYAVMVGNFQSADDKDFKETLNKIKTSYPNCMKGTTAGNTVPFIYAIGTPHPDLPEDIFNRKGYVDEFVERLNSDSKYNLLENRGTFTVKVATFTGLVEMTKNLNDAKMKKDTDGKVLRQAAINAAELCKALRLKGWEAYEYHDRHCSIVTIGSFNEVTSEGPQGMTVMRPEIDIIIEKFKGEHVGSKNAQQLPYMPKSMIGIEFDLQPQVITVPKKLSSLKRR